MNAFAFVYVMGNSREIYEDEEVLFSFSLEKNADSVLLHIQGKFSLKNARLSPLFSFSGFQ